MNCAEVIARLHATDLSEKEEIEIGAHITECRKCYHKMVGEVPTSNKGWEELLSNLRKALPVSA